FKGSFCRSKDHLDDSASSTETSHVTLPTRGNVELGVPWTWPSLPLPPLSVYVKCYITQLLKASTIVPPTIVGIDFESTSSIIGAIYALSSINKALQLMNALKSKGVGVNTRVEQTDGVVASLGENTNVNHQTSSSVVPEGGRSASNNQIFDPKNGKKKARLDWIHLENTNHHYISLCFYVVLFVWLCTII
uniref:Uncharacterized protein n=2 Tax=Brassica oleracea var. oleracea TaxID=109376 RepID=A0A0D3BPH1_BRAOL